MPKTDKRIDAYIAKAPDLAKPILEKVRAMVHEGAPGAEETLKWGHPAFVQDGILCGMAAFKQHCVVHFWKGALIYGKTNPFPDRIVSVSDLPAKKAFLGYVNRAIELNATGARLPRAPAKPKKPIPMPGDFEAAIGRNARARATYEGFSPSHRREYLEWITEAKQKETRARRIAQAVEWMAEGKPRNWKYL